jgi:signal transduction histidine kinase
VTGSPARRPGVRTLLTVASVGVAVVALLVAAVLTSPLVRSSTERVARDSLARDADLVARLPLGDRLAARPDAPVLRPVVNRRGIAVGVITADGTTRGAALALSEADRQRALSGAAVSSEGELAGEPVLIEARPLSGGAVVVLASPASDIDASVATQRRRLLLALGLGVLMALAAGALAARSLARPLTALAATARRLTDGDRGVTPAELPRSTPREVAEVSDALRLLDEGLATSEERQRRFLLSVSHELRTPLTSIRGYAESLVDGAYGPDEVPGVGATLVTEADRLERHVADLLALARLEADDFSLVESEVDLARLLADGVAGWADRVARAELSLELEAPAQLFVRTDPGRVRQVLDLLTDNAVRVCPRGSRIVWSASPRAGGVHLEVRDSGPGFTEADAVDAFVPGVLRDRYSGARPVGSGLGLAIAHRLVTRLGGAIRLTRAPEGGASFEVDLPGRP